ncbi:peptide deformylase (macronuclear) [Tetrahymena thermophila SB210]|uniref:Peptide deformylase n=1 Tax=Tetrahymena thermophila (strain SB210) TaxID=312017 RepID=W7XB95_TETTS|nr:peptide deformylase [Tetrahymena thermophila SB210]EWS73693.1 peptide deformylase [Tetrahymena thermophila SB210]|eukprot:XP_012653731.1 peptide deformylase [Tetrahymena thermophila SB210]
MVNIIKNKFCFKIFKNSINKLLLVGISRFFSKQLQYIIFLQDQRQTDIMQKKKYTAKLLQLFFFSKEQSKQSLLLPQIETGYPTKQLKQSILDMKKTAFVYQLPYLSSNQIGIEKSVVVFSNKIVENKYYDSEYVKFDTYLNPKITKISNQKLEDFEECTSTFGIESQVERHTDILIQYMDEEGNMKEEEMSGFKSRLFQQAIDLQSGKLPIKWNISKGKNRISEKYLNLQNAKLFQSALEQYNQAVINYLSNTQIAPEYFDRSLDSLNIPKEMNNKRFSIKDETYDIHEKQFIEEIQELQEELLEFVELNKLPRMRIVK